MGNHRTKQDPTKMSMMSRNIVHCTSCYWLLHHSQADMATTQGFLQNLSGIRSMQGARSLSFAMPCLCVCVRLSVASAKHTHAHASNPICYLLSLCVHYCLTPQGSSKLHQQMPYSSDLIIGAMHEQTHQATQCITACASVDRNTTWCPIYFISDPIAHHWL